MMCDIATALTIGSSLVSYQQQQQQAKAQRRAADASYAVQREQTLRRLEEERQATAQANMDTYREAMAQKATASTSAGQAGVTGISVNNLLNDVSFEQGVITSRNLKTLDNRYNMTLDELNALQTQRSARYEENPLPSMFGTALEIGTAGYSGMKKQNPDWNPFSVFTSPSTTTTSRKTTGNPYRLGDY